MKMSNKKPLINNFKMYLFQCFTSKYVQFKFPQIEIFELRIYIQIIFV